jgi:hypothetical protein
MPALNETIRGESLPGYGPVPTLPAPPIPPSSTIPLKGQNRNLRSPLPPIASSYDSVRQFNEVGETPRFRNMPLPLSMTSGGGSVTNITQVTSTSGGGSSSSTVSLAAKSVLLSTPVIAAGNQLLTTVTMARSFQLLSIVASLPCGVRLYGSSTAQSLDAIRGIDDPVAAEVGQGIITDLVFDTSPFSWGWQDRIGANNDTTQTTTIYITVLNNQAVSQAVTVTIRYVPLQTS